MSQPESPLSGRSPWAALAGVHAAHIVPKNAPVTATLRVPGSKSFTNRALLMAGFAHGASELRGILRSDDSYWCIKTLEHLGVPIRVTDRAVYIQGVAGRWPECATPLFVGSAGTSARFLPGLLATSSGGPWTLDGSTQLRGRPVGPLFTTLRTLGAEIACLGAEQALPVRITGTGLQGGEVSMAGDTSSQFISGILMAAPYAKVPTTIRVRGGIVQHAYVMMTIDMMRDFGVQVEHDAALTRMHVPGQAYQGRQLDLEADASTAGYFFALAALTQGRVCVANLNTRTRQPDIKLLQVLTRMGCQVTENAAGITLQGPPRLRGGIEVDMREMSDQTLTLAALAPFATGPVRIRGVAHIRHHESDRIAVMCAALRQMQVTVEEHPDGMTIQPATPRGQQLESHDDHRVAMSLAVMGARVPGIVIEDPGCVSKTCPAFFDVLREVGIAVDLREGP